MDTQIAGTLEAWLTREDREVAEDLLARIAQSIVKHLTPDVVAALASRGVTVDDAIEHLARRALEAVIADGRAREAAGR